MLCRRIHNDTAFDALAPTRLQAHHAAAVLRLDHGATHERVTVDAHARLVD